MSWPMLPESLLPQGGLWPYASPPAAVAGLAALRRTIAAGLLLSAAMAHAMLDVATYARTLAPTQYLKVMLLT